MSIETERWKLRLIVPSTTSWPCDETYTNRYGYLCSQRPVIARKTIIIILYKPPLNNLGVAVKLHH